LITLALDDKSREAPLTDPTEIFEGDWQLIAVKELGAARRIWLGVRDDFRPWLQGLTQTTPLRALLETLELAVWRCSRRVRLPKHAFTSLAGFSGHSHHFRVDGAQPI
jgi:hypothetical protein